jgi:hypothetical protein
MALAAGHNINDLIRSLRKLISLLPITPIDAAILRELYENTAKILIAA